ncbi:MAG: hypothetical protein OEM03_06585 [Chromatiales bacterium]|nr:hypothetical protein [Chromatiales bacterium]
MMGLFKELVRLREHLLMGVLTAVMLALSFTIDWNYLYAVALLVAAWLYGLTKSVAWMRVEDDKVVLRHELGWVVGQASLEGVAKIILYRRPIPPDNRRLETRNNVIHIDNSRVHTLCVSAFVEEVKARGIEVDSTRIREGLFTPRRRKKIKFKMGRGR